MATDINNNLLASFVSQVQEAENALYRLRWPSLTPEKVSVKPGVKYTRVDIGSSGRYMVVNATEEIYGIKAYGVINRRHYYGTLRNPASNAFRRV